MIAAAGLTTAVIGMPAQSLIPPTTHITRPLDHAHWLITNANPPSSVVVRGTSNLTTGATLDIRCYIQPGSWMSGPESVPVDVDGNFHIHMQTDDAYGTCKLRAVPHGLPAGSDVSAFFGPRVTTEWRTTERIESGPNAGTLHDYYVEYVSKHAMNDYSSLTRGAFWDTHVQYPNGSSSGYLWYGVGVLDENLGGTRPRVKIDGHNAFGPDSAQDLFGTAGENPGYRGLTFSVHRNATTGTYTIHETDPFVFCPHETFPPTASSCPRFKSTGIRLERTIVAKDGGLQVQITDVWRSTDGRRHHVSAHYVHYVDGLDRTNQPYVLVPVGLKLPWVSNTYQTFTVPTLYPGPTHVPATIYVHGNNLAADGDKNFARGAMSFDRAPTKVERTDNGVFLMRYDLTVRAGGTKSLREFFVTGTQQSVVNQKAAANRQHLG